LVFNYLEAVPNAVKMASAISLVNGSGFVRVRIVNKMGRTIKPWPK